MSDSLGVVLIDAGAAGVIGTNGSSSDDDPRVAAAGGAAAVRHRRLSVVASVAEELADRLGGRCLVRAAFVDGDPNLSSAVGHLVDDGATRLISMSLDPLPDVTGAHAEIARLADGVPVQAIRAWHLDEELLGHLAEEVSEGLGSDLNALDTHVLFVGRSQPLDALGPDRRYAVALREMAQDVSARLGLPRRSLAWSSPGPGEGWLGPDLLSVLPALSEAHGIRSVVLCPCHADVAGPEVVWDIDHEAELVAVEWGIRLTRTPVAGTRGWIPSVVARLLADAVPL